MRHKNYLILGLSILFSILLIGGVFAEVSHCCEKTKVNSGGSGGAWCVDASASECDSSYLMEPTACSSTSYCALGTCVNRVDGECMENTPQRSCDSSIGFWSEEDPQNIPQCQLGCCAVGDQAAFVTQTKCKSFASLYSIDTHFQTNIQDEVSCIASAFPDSKGACVFDRELETTCKMLTRSECAAITDSDFHDGFLCTADDLATNCAPTDQTTCVEGKDEVFFVDSCGNTANIYDASMIAEDAGGQIVPSGGDGIEYWTYITAPSCTLTLTDSASTNTADSCGDCNYYEGSTCKKYDRIKDLESADYGDYVCRNLGCEYEFNGQSGIQDEEKFLHGETWCAESSGTTFLDVTGGDIQNAVGINNLNTNLPGSRYYRMVCYNGEVSVEPCADKRAEVCIQSTRDILRSDGTVAQADFRSATCRVNAWQTCTAQDNPEDCENLAERDCKWIGNGKCVPLISPGFEFWSEEETDADEICGLASTTCTGRISVPLEESPGDSLGGFAGRLISGVTRSDRETEYSGGDCFEISGGDKLAYRPQWGEQLNQMCVSLGDCQGQISGKITPKTGNYLQ